MKELKNPIAELSKPDSGENMKPEEALKLSKDVKYYCPDPNCKDLDRRLILVKKEKGRSYFRHHYGFDHDIKETILHKEAIKWFVGKENFEIPSLKFEAMTYKTQVIELNIEKTELEYNLLKQIIPDVRLQTAKGFEFAIEIVVTSDVKEDKAKLIKDFNLPTLRIDLSNFYKKNQRKCREDIDFVKSKLNSLLTDIQLKEWVVEPKEEEVENILKLKAKEEKGELIWGPFLLLGIGVYIFRKVFRKKRRFK